MSRVREGGYWGRIGIVNLSKRVVRYWEPDRRLYRGFLGGLGIGVKLLIDRSPPRVDPLAPENVLVFAVGPVEGLSLAGAARVGSFFKSPLTGFFGESFCGGYLGTELARAGFDGIVVEGASDKPVYLLVEDGKIEVRDAGHLWGLDAYEAERELWKEHGEVMTAAIGPAGENLVRFANIVHGLYLHEKKGLRGGFFGRTGGGAVMGSKRLKALVIKGNLGVEAGDPKLLEELRSKVVKLARERLRSLTKYGTSAIMTLTNSTGSLPTRYYQDGSFPGYEKIGPETMNQTIVKKRVACFACPVACGRHTEIDDLRLEGPEYETLYALGPLTYVDDLEAIARANDAANRLGLDTITAGNVIALAMYLTEKKIIREEGFRFGDGGALVKAMELIAYRKGIGDVLAEGARKAAERLGAPDAAIHVKGLEFPGYEPRALKAVALAYAVSARGACHLRHVAYRPCLVGKHPFNPEVGVDRLSYEGHVEYVVELEDFHAIVDSLILCKFYTLPVIGPLLWNGVAEVYRAATGASISLRELRKIGERINNLIRLYNLREGLRREDDALPPRLYREPLASGPSKGEIIDKARFEEMLDEFYRLRGWSSEGVPGEEKLEELGLTGYATQS